MGKRRRTVLHYHVILINIVSFLPCLSHTTGIIIIIIITHCDHSHTFLFHFVGGVGSITFYSCAKKCLLVDILKEDLI